MFTCDTGYEDHIQSVCSDLWVHAMRFHSISTPTGFNQGVAQSSLQNETFTSNS